MDLAGFGGGVVRPVRPPLATGLTSGVDVFAHVCGQKADTSTNYCESIHLYDKTLQFSVKCVRLFFFGNYHKFKLLTFAR